MARKVQRIEITSEGRDQGKVFVVTEMDASRAELWAMKALLALIKENPELPDGLEYQGMAALASLGIPALSKLPFDVIVDLMEEMFTCVRVAPDKSNPDMTRSLIDNDIEEVGTRLKLRMDILKLHWSFSSAAS